MKFLWKLGKQNRLFLLPLFSVCVGIWSGIWKNEGSALSISLVLVLVLVFSLDFQNRTDKRWWACAQYCRNGVVPILVSLPVGNSCFYREIQGFQSKLIVLVLLIKLRFCQDTPNQDSKEDFFFPLLTVANYNNPFK